MEKKIGIACDHAGYEMKEFLVGCLGARGYDVHDFGTYSEERADYADFAHPLAEAVESGELAFGIGLCGSGEGMAMTLNKHQGIRAGLVWDKEIAHLIRQHNDANVLVLPARFITNDQALEFLDEFIATPFEGDRHVARIAKMPLAAWEEARKTTKESRGTDRTAGGFALRPALPTETSPAAPTHFVCRGGLTFGKRPQKARDRAGRGPAAERARTVYLLSTARRPPLGHWKPRIRNPPRTGRTGRGQRPHIRGTAARRPPSEHRKAHIRSPNSAPEAQRTEKRMDSARYSRKSKART